MITYTYGSTGSLAATAAPHAVMREGGPKAQNQIVPLSHPAVNVKYFAYVQRRLAFRGNPTASCYRIMP